MTDVAGGFDLLSPALLGLYREKWMAIGFRTDPADRGCAEAGMRMAYQAVGARPPARYRWYGSPLAAARARAVSGRRGAEPPDVPIGLVLSASQSQAPYVGSSRTVELLSAPLRTAVWNAVGLPIAAELRASQEPGVSRVAWYGQHRTADLAVLACLREAGIATRDEDGLTGLELFAESGSWAWPDETVCWLCERPRIVRRDARGRLHAEDGPAVQYDDGWSVYAWHGLVVPAAVIERPGDLTVEEIHDIANVELRRHVIERIGYDRYLRQAGATLVHSDRCGDLYRREYADDEALQVVHVVNSTAEPDGSHRRYTLRVPPEIRTARAAVAWTFGIHESDYEPAIES